MFLVSRLLIPSLSSREAGKNIREKGRTGRTGGYVPGQYVANGTPGHPQNVRFQNVRFQNVRFQNI